MFRNTLLTLLILFISIAAHAQEKPKLVVGIVVDQMRQDYLTRYYDRFSKDGFRRLTDQGYNYENCQYSYVPTYTAPGHATIYTGTTPAIHGIVANDWYDRKWGRVIYCTDDTSKRAVGAKKQNQSSPQHLNTTTITDQLRLATNFRSKVIGIALKDRSSILPAGHSGNAAYWYDTKAGRLVSSTHYLEELPQWMQDFNARLLPDKYLEQTWTPLFPLSSYLASAADSNAYEGKLDKERSPVFPYDLAALQKSWGYKLLNFTPWGNTYTFEAGKAAIAGEQLGADAITDFLCLSFSATDYAGHFFGPQAVEVEDIYLRMDRDLAAFFQYLDKTVGKGKWSVFLTADHGGNDVPALLKDHKIPSGLLAKDSLEKLVQQLLYKKYGDSLFITFMNEQIYLDQVKIRKMGLNTCEVAKYVADGLKGFPGISRIYTSCEMEASGGASVLPVEQRLYRGYDPLRSGDILLLTAPGWMDFENRGTTHGSPYPYDARIPLLFYGAGFKKGKSSREVSVTDISPTLAIMLGINFPNGCTGAPLEEVLGY